MQFMDKGGIIFYSIQEHDWAKAAAFSWKLVQYAQAIKKAEPHKVMVAAGYEPEGPASPLAEGKEVFGTVDDYLLYRKNLKKAFDAMEVTNAIWVMDYGDKCAFDSRYCEAITKLFPQDDSVGWIFFNFFQTMGQDMYKTVHTNNPLHAPNWD